MKNLPTYIIIALVCAVLALGWLLYISRPSAPVGEHVPAKAAPEVRNTPKIDLNVPKVRVYTQTAKKALKLPEKDIADANTAVIESTRVAESARAQTITTLIDSRTGETRTLVRQEELPWFAFRKTGALAMSHDFIRNLNTLSVRQDFFQVKQFYLSGEAAIRSDRDKRLEFKIEYRW